MEEYIRRENLRLFQSKLDQAKDEIQRQLLLKLLAAEKAKVAVETR